MVRKSTKPLSPYTQYIRTIQKEMLPDMSLTAIKGLPEVKHTWKCMELQRKADACQQSMMEHEMMGMEDKITVSKRQPKSQQTIRDILMEDEKLAQEVLSMIKSRIESLKRR